MNCTRCGGLGFINLHQAPPDVVARFMETGNVDVILGWIENECPDTDCSVCDCCGNGDTWYGEPGEHNNFRGPGASEPFPECY